MCEAVDNFGLEKSIVNWICNMLQNKIFTINVCETTLKVRTARGCPREGVLSPLLWILVVDGTLRVFGDESFIVQGYAVDLAISVRCKYVLYLTYRM